MENRIELWVSPTGNVAVYRGNAFIPTEQLTEEERLFVLNRVCDELKGKIDLEAEIKKYTENLYNETFGNGQCTLDEFDLEDIATVIEETARHFAQLQKEQMLKEAVEGEVCGRVYDHINVRFADGVCKFLEPKNISHIPADVSKYKVGDKVRMIVCKKED